MRNPSAGKRKRKDVIGWSKVLTQGEQHQLMSYLQAHATNVSGQRLFLICDILLNTGLRASELCALRWRDTPAVLNVKAIEVYRGKGDKDRTVPVSDRLVLAITKYIRFVRPKTLPRHVRRSDVNRPLFYSNLGRPYRRHALFAAVRRAGNLAGIAKPISPHKFRHTFATNALVKHIDLVRLQKMLGHTELATTSKYLDIAEGLDGQIGEQIDQSFEPALPGVLPA